MDFDRKLVGTFALVYLGAALLGLGVAYSGGFAKSTSPSTASTSSPYVLTLFETMNIWNQTSPPQPRFYILSDHGLENFTTITLPAHRQIQLTIVSYDTPTPGSLDQQGQVVGTSGGTAFLMNGTTASMGMMRWGGNVSSVPGAALAHTFTITSQDGTDVANIPVVGGSTVMANLYFDKAGPYKWVCLTPCGFGLKGDKGSMSTQGWMVGQIAVQ